MPWPCALLADTYPTLTLPCRGPAARSLDADLWLLLTEAEEGEYLARSVRAAAARCADLVPCPAPGCEGLAVAGDGPQGPPQPRLWPTTFISKCSARPKCILCCMHRWRPSVRLAALAAALAQAGEVLVRSCRRC